MLQFTLKSWIFAPWNIGMPINDKYHRGVMLINGKNHTVVITLGVQLAVIVTFDFVAHLITLHIL